jgi:ABC-type multidrug transport system fused ATPase/permease subunit
VNGPKNLRELRAHSRSKTPVAKISRLTKRPVGALRQKTLTLGATSVKAPPWAIPGEPNRFSTELAKMEENRCGCDSLCKTRWDEWTMDHLKQIAGLAESLLKPRLDQVGTIDPGILVIILLLIVIVALASRSLLIFLESVFLALVGFLILLLPSYATTLIGIGAGLGSLLITFVGIRSRAIERQKYNKLSHVVRQLELAEQRHFLRSLNSPKGKALIEKGQRFSTEELQAAFAQVLTEANGNEREVIKVAMNALMARKATERGNGSET